MADAKDVVRQVEEAWARNDLAALDALVAHDVVSHDAPPGMPPGLEGAKAGHSMFLAAFPDRTLTIDRIFGEGDLVTVRTTTRGTNTGGLPFLSIPANGRPIEVESISVYRVAGGRVVEHWGLNDAMALMMQLGAMAPPAGTPAQ